MATLSDFTAISPAGQVKSLSEYGGKVVLVVNTASKCGFIPQYEGLEKIGVLGDKIKWNFTKFLIGRDGTVLKRYGSTTKPEKIAGDIEKAVKVHAE